MIRTEDKEYIKSVFCHPEVYSSLVDDFSPKNEEYQPVVIPEVTYLRPEEGGACFMFVPHNQSMWEIHSAVLPDHRKHSLKYVNECREWLKQNTNCKTVITLVPEGNYPAHALAERAGMQKVGIIPKSIQKGGKLLNQTLLSMEL